MGLTVVFELILYAYALVMKNNAREQAAIENPEFSEVLYQSMILENYSLFTNVIMLLGGILAVVVALKLGLNSKILNWVMGILFGFLFYLLNLLGFSSFWK